jgi:four helix bundle protein
MSGNRDRDVSTFEDLEVFQRAYRISLEVHRASLQFPTIEQRALADQIRRASKSICGNIAEGFGKRRRSSAEFKRYLLMAIGSADEMQVWLRYCADLEYVEQKTCATGVTSSAKSPRCCRPLHGLGRVFRFLTADY